MSPPGGYKCRCTSITLGGMLHVASHIHECFGRYRHACVHQVQHSLHCTNLVTGNIPTNSVKPVWKCLLYCHKLCVEYFVDLFRNCEALQCSLFYLYDAQSEFYAVSSPLLVALGVKLVIGKYTTIRCNLVLHY